MNGKLGKQAKRRPSKQAKPITPLRHIGKSVSHIRRALGRLGLTVERILDGKKPSLSSLRAARADLADAMDQIIQAGRKL